MQPQNNPYQPVASNSGFNAYASGDKRYGGGLRSAPNVGAVQNKTGYNRRDIQAQARQDAYAQMGGSGNASQYPLSQRYL